MNVVRILFPGTEPATPRTGRGSVFGKVAVCGSQGHEDAVVAVLHDDSGNREVRDGSVDRSARLLVPTMVDLVDSVLIGRCVAEGSALGVEVARAVAPVPGHIGAIEALPHIQFGV